MSATKTKTKTKTTTATNSADSRTPREQYEEQGFIVQRVLSSEDADELLVNLLQDVNAAETQTFKPAYRVKWRRSDFSKRLVRDAPTTKQPQRRQATDRLKEIRSRFSWPGKTAGFMTCDWAWWNSATEPMVRAVAPHWAKVFCSDDTRVRLWHRPERLRIVLPDTKASDDAPLVHVDRAASQVFGNEQLEEVGQPHHGFVVLGSGPAYLGLVPGSHTQEWRDRYWSACSDTERTSTLIAKSDMTKFIPEHVAHASRVASVDDAIRFVRVAHGEAVFWDGALVHVYGGRTPRVARAVMKLYCGFNRDGDSRNAQYAECARRGVKFSHYPSRQRTRTLPGRVNHRMFTSRLLGECDEYADVISALDSWHSPQPNFPYPLELNVSPAEQRPAAKRARN